jgi:hypothetical protein
MRVFLHVGLNVPAQASGKRNGGITSAFPCGLSSDPNSPQPPLPPQMPLGCIRHLAKWASHEIAADYFQTTAIDLFSGSLGQAGFCPRSYRHQTRSSLMAFRRDRSHQATFGANGISFASLQPLPSPLSRTDCQDEKAHGNHRKDAHHQSVFFVRGHGSQSSLLRRSRKNRSRSALILVTDFSTACIASRLAFRHAGEFEAA